MSDMPNCRVDSAAARWCWPKEEPRRVWTFAAAHRGLSEPTPLNPVNLVERMYGLFFTGGSAFGLNVSDGVMRFLSERGAGYDTGAGIVPIVGGAVIFDLSLNRTGPRPDAALGYLACQSATSDPRTRRLRGSGPRRDRRKAPRDHPRDERRPGKLLRRNIDGNPGSLR